MDTAEIIVTLAGVALAGFVIWYFFFPARQTASAVSSSIVGGKTVPNE